MSQKKNVTLARDNVEDDRPGRAGVIGQQTFTEGYLMQVIELEPEPIPAACPALIDLSSPQKETRKETVNLSSPPRASMINPVVNLISPSAPSAAAKTTRTTSVKSAKSAAVKGAVSAAAGEASGVADLADLPTDFSLIEDDCNSEDPVDLANMQKIQTRLGLTISMLNTVKAHVEVQTDKAKERKIQVNEWIMPGIMFLFSLHGWLSG